jgi:hypothetical protein
MNIREALQACIPALEATHGKHDLVAQARAALADGPALVSIKVEHEPDTSPDLDWIGTYSNEPGPADRTVDREACGDWGGSHDYAYFIAANSGDETGNSDSVKQDYQRMEAYNNQQWYMLGIRAAAKVQCPDGSGSYRLEYFSSGGLWGIESDSDKDYIQEIKNEQLDDLYAHLEHFGVDLSNWDALTAKAATA